MRQAETEPKSVPGEELTDLPVVALDGAFLPGAVGVGVVDLGFDDGLDGGEVEELAAVVRKDGCNFL